MRVTHPPSPSYGLLENCVLSNGFGRPRVQLGLNIKEFFSIAFIVLFAHTAMLRLLLKHANLRYLYMSLLW